MAARYLDGERLEEFELAVGELLANAVVHGDRTTDIDIGFTYNGSVLVEATSRGQYTGPARPGQDFGGGFGLRIIQRLADGWGLKSDGVTRAWFSFDTA